jgi:type II secretory pathway predicted ATPase ExeA
VALRYSMTGMELAETASYVAHHLKIAGRTDTLFSDDALALVHQVSRGLPRAVNNLAVQSLVAAFAAKKAIVDESSARAAPNRPRLTSRQLPARPSRRQSL